MPPEWVFQDEGYSGAILVRPGLRRCAIWRLRGKIAAVLVVIFAGPAGSRKYAYQVLLSEELSRCGVELDLSEGAAAGATRRINCWCSFKA